MRSPPLPGALRSTVAERRVALERCVENALDAAARYDAARAAIGLGPAEPLFVLRSAVDELVARALAEHEAARAAKVAETAKKARTRSGPTPLERDRMRWDPNYQPASAPQPPLSAAATFRMLDLHFSRLLEERRRGPDFADDFANSLNALRVIALADYDDPAPPGTMETVMAVLLQKLERLGAFERAEQLKAEEERAAEEAVERGEVLPLRRRPNETVERTL
jgi:hypothetical protein